MTADALVEDAGDVDRRTAEERAAAEAAEHARRSSALKREPALPRPLVLDDDMIAGVLEEAESELDKASGLIRTEMAELLQHDAVKYPVHTLTNTYSHTPQTHTTESLSAHCCTQCLLYGFAALRHRDTGT